MPGLRLVAFGFGRHHYGAPHRQQAENIEHRNVETQRAERQPAIVRAEFQLVQRIDDAVHRAAMFYRHPFRRAGRAGGEDHIGQRGRCRQNSLARRSRRQLHDGSLRIDRQQPGLAAGPPLPAAQNHPGLRLRDDIEAAAFRPGAVQRQIGLAGHQNRQHRNDLRPPFVHHHCDGLGAHVRVLTQLQRQRQRPPIQLTVAQLAPFIDDCHPLRIALSLADEVMMDGAFEIVGRWTGLMEGALPRHFTLRDQRQLADALLPVIDDLREDRQIILPQQRQRSRCKQGGGIVEDRPPALRRRLDAQRQIEFGRLVVRQQILRRQPGRRGPRLLQREQRLEQRMARQIARHLQQFDQLIQRQILIPLRLQHAVKDAMHIIVQRRRIVYLRAQRQRVDEESDR